MDPAKAEPHPYITREMHDALMAYQKEHDLKVDGMLFPEGETQEKINQDIKDFEVESDGAESEDIPPAAPPSGIEREPLPSPNIPGTDIPDDGTPEHMAPNIPSEDRGHGRHHSVPMPPAKVPSPGVDPGIELPVGDPDAPRIQLPLKPEWLI